MAFADELNAWAAKVKRLNATLFINLASAALHCVKYGSALTGSPGQPVDTSNLLNSFQLEFVSATEALISTNVVYAPIIEYNLRGATLRSSVGGFHSISLLVAGWQRVVDAEVAKLAA